MERREERKAAKTARHDWVATATAIYGIDIEHPHLRPDARGGMRGDGARGVGAIVDATRRTGGDLGRTRSGSTTSEWCSLGVRPFAEYRARMDLTPGHDDLVLIEHLLDRADSKFSLVTLAARRARNVNSYFGQLGEGLGSIVPPQVTSVARKPLSIAFEEIATDKIVAVRLDGDPMVEGGGRARARRRFG